MMYRVFLDIVCVCEGVPVESILAESGEQKLLTLALRKKTE